MPDGSGRSAGAIPGVRSSSDQQTLPGRVGFVVGEARLLAQFDRPSLVKVFRSGRRTTPPIWSCRYSGMTFKQARAQMRTPPPEAWLRKVLWSVLGRCGCCTTARRCTAIFRQTTSSCKTMAPVLLDLGAARHAINDQGRQAHLRCSGSTMRPLSSIQETDDDLRQGPWSDLYSLWRSCMAACATTRLCRPPAFHSRSHGAVPYVPMATGCASSLASSIRPICRMTRPLFAPKIGRVRRLLAGHGNGDAPEGIDGFDFRGDLGRHLGRAA